MFSNSVQTSTAIIQQRATVFLAASFSVASACDKRLFAVPHCAGIFHKLRLHGGFVPDIDTTGTRSGISAGRIPPVRS